MSRYYNYHEDLGVAFERFRGVVSLELSLDVKRQQMAEKWSTRARSLLGDYRGVTAGVTPDDVRRIAQWEKEQDHPFFKTLEVILVDGLVETALAMVFTKARDDGREIHVVSTSDAAAPHLGLTEEQVDTILHSLGSTKSADS